MEERDIHSEGKSADDFLIAQFSALGSHIDGLFNSAIQRVAAYLVFAGLIFAGIQLVEESQRLIYFAGGLFSTALVGFFVWIESIHVSARAIQYFRIVNRIRGHFHRYDSSIETLCAPLPLTDGKPRWNDPVFDSGVPLVQAIMALSISGFVGSIAQLLTLALPLWVWLTFLIMVLGISWLILH